MADQTGNDLLDAYNEYASMAPSLIAVHNQTPGASQMHVMDYQTWLTWRAQADAAGLPPDASPLQNPNPQPKSGASSTGTGAAAQAAAAGSSAPNANAEAQQRAGSMPATGSTGLIGFDGTTTLSGAPTDYTPYLTTTTGGTAKGGSPAYSNGMEYTAWQDQNEDSRVQWKQALWYAGFYNGQRPVLNGDIAPEDVTAMKAAMGLGNLNGKSWQDAIAPRVKLGEQQGGAYTGKDSTRQNASGVFDQTVTGLRQFAEDNGINLTEDFIGKQAQAIASGVVSSDEVLGNLRDKYVAPAFPSFAEQIKAGQSVKDLAAPYTATMAKLLEIPETDVKVSDPMIQQAIQAVDDKGNGATVPLWQFEKQVKSDSRYQYTSNAWNDVGQQAYKVMQMFGLQG